MEEDLYERKERPGIFWTCLWTADTRRADSMRLKETNCCQAFWGLCILTTESRCRRQRLFVSSCPRNRFAEKRYQKFSRSHPANACGHFSKGRRFQRQSLWSRPAGREILCLHKDQEGRRGSPVGCCVAGNPIQGFPDAA